MRTSRFHFIWRDLLVLAPVALLGAAWVAAAPRHPSQGLRNSVSTAVSDFDSAPSATSSSTGVAAVTPTPTPTPTPRPDQTSFIEGLVTDARTKKPLAGANITLEGYDDSFETTTGADGRYRINHVAPRAGYAWSVSHKGYSGRSNYRGQGPEVTVAAQGLKFDIPLLRLGVARGIVRDIAGHPVAGAKVSISRVQDYDSDLVKTNHEGRFESRILPVSFATDSALYRVRVFTPRLSGAETRVRVSAWYQRGDEASVRLTLKPRAVISGRVTYRGKPLAKATVLVENQSGFAAVQADPHAYTSTDANGRYSLKVSAPARYGVSIYSEDTIPQLARVAVSPGRVVALNRDLKPAPYGSIRGRIVDLSGRGVKGAGIELWTPDTSETMPLAVTDARGRFFIAKVAPFDNYRVSVTMPGADRRGGVSIESVRVRPHRTTPVFARGDTIRPQLQVLNAVPAILKAGEFSLRLRASDNQGLSSAYLKVDKAWAINGRESSDKDFENPHKKAPRHATITLPWDARTVSNGPHTLKVVVTDLVGNVTSQSFKVRVQGSPFKAKPDAGY